MATAAGNLAYYTIFHVYIPMQPYTWLPLPLHAQDSKSISFTNKSKPPIMRIEPEDQQILNKKIKRKSDGN